MAPEVSHKWPQTPRITSCSVELAIRALELPIRALELATRALELTIRALRYWPSGNWNN